MKTFTAALLVAAVCLLAASGAVQAGRIGPGRELKQFRNGLGNLLLRYVERKLSRTILT